MKIWMAASECSPWVKSGGLGEAVSSLSTELARRGHEVRIFIPGYSSIDRRAFTFHDGYVSAPVGNDSEPGELWSAETAEGLVVTLVENDQFFRRAGLYGEGGSEYPDNDRRFSFFSWIVAGLAARQQPDILHAHDWQAGMSLFLARHAIKMSGSFPGLVFTIHNGGYQGSFPIESIDGLGLEPELETRFMAGGPLEFYGRLNFLKTGLLSAHVANTVSPTHAKETCTEEFGFGLDGIYRALGNRYCGILNGINLDEWNPARDGHLPEHFSSRQLEGKRRLKAEAIHRFGLYGYPDDPLIGIVSRLAWQKGIDVALRGLPEIIQRGAKLIVLGSGEAELETGLKSLAARYPDRVGVRIGFDEPSAHLVTAAADLMLVPSRYEPCGLVQMQAMRYGALPVATRTGGLADTVTDIHEHPGAGTGFLFDSAEAGELTRALHRAINTHWMDRKSWEAAIREAMTRDFSWGRAALGYEDLYRQALAVRTAG